MSMYLPIASVKQRDGCSNRAQRRGSSQDKNTDKQRHRDRQTERERDRLTEDVAEGNRTKGKSKQTDSGHKQDCLPTTTTTTDRY